MAWSHNCLAEVRSIRRALTDGLSGAVVKVKERDCSAQFVASSIFGGSLDRNAGVRRLLHVHDVAGCVLAPGTVWDPATSVLFPPCSLRLIMTDAGHRLWSVPGR